MAHNCFPICLRLLEQQIYVNKVVDYFGHIQIKGKDSFY